MLIKTCRNGTIEQCDTASRDEATLETQGAPRRGLAFAPDGKVVAVGEDKDVILCDPASLQIKTRLISLPAPVGSLSWSPNGGVLAVGGDDCKVYLVDVALKQIIGTFDRHQWPVTSFGWAEDGKVLVTGSHGHYGESDVCVWDVGLGKQLRTIPDGGEVSPDGRLVAWRGQSAIRLRETETGQVVSTLLSLRDSQYAAISPEGHFSGSPGVEKELVYVVQTDEGQFTLTPDEFAEKYGWKNDPEKVRLDLGAPAKSE
jgi:WD40 repeat protein